MSSVLLAGSDDMFSLMSSLTLAMREPHLAVSTFERLLAGMNPFVLGSGGLIPESVSTEPTLVRSIPTMDHLVMFLVFDLEELLAAVTTLVGYFVIHLCLVIVERFLTDSTSKLCRLCFYPFLEVKFGSNSVSIAVFALQTETVLSLNMMIYPC